MGIALPGQLAEAMALMGVEFPGTDEDSLAAAADQWRSVAGQCSGWHSDLRAAVAHVSNNNDNAASGAFLDYVQGQSNMTSLQALAENAQAIASGFEKTASAVRGLKITCIATASAVAAYLQVMRASSAPDPDAVQGFVQHCAAIVQRADAQCAAVIGRG